MAKIPKTIQDKLLQKINQPLENDEPYVVQVWLGRDDDESYLLSGNTQEIISQASLLKAHQDLLDNYDIGTIIGQPLNDAVARKIDLGLELIISLRGNYKRPFAKKSRNYQDKLRRSVSIPFARKPVFAEIKRAFNLLDNGYPHQLWGQWEARAWLSSGNSLDKSLVGVPQVVVAGTSKAGAISNLERLLQLSDGKIIKGPVPKEDKSLHNSYKVYPYQLVIVHKQLSHVGKGRKTKSGNIASRTGTLWLYPKTEPVGWENTVRELTKRG